MSEQFADSLITIWGLKRNITNPVIRKFFFHIYTDTVIVDESRPNFFLAIFSSNWWKTCIFLDIFKKLVDGMYIFESAILLKYKSKIMQVRHVFLGARWNRKYLETPFCQPIICGILYHKREFPRIPYTVRAWHI